MKNVKVRHVAIIMDGNGRWAERRGLPKVEGHRQGARQVTEVLKAAQEYGVEFLTLYAFSTENWKRPVAEVTALMGLLEEFIDDKLPELMKNGIRLRTIGRTEDLFPGARKKLLHAIEMTEKGGRFPKVTEESFRNYLYAPDIPDPDLLIRTSGELRLSNFLLWELSYSEMYVTDTLWPDFGKKEFEEALEAYGQRDRRFGGRK